MNLCTNLVKVCNFRPSCLLSFNIGVMVETVFCSYEIYRFLASAFCFVDLDFLVYVDLDFQILFFVNIENLIFEFSGSEKVLSSGGS